MQHEAEDERTPGAREGRHHRRRHRRQQRRLSPREPGLEGPPAHRQGPAAEPGRLDRPRLQLPVLVDHNKEMAELTVESARQYQAWDVYTDLRRPRGRPDRDADERAPTADGLGQELGHRDARLVTPAEIKELVPFIDESILVGGFYTPGVGVCDSLQFGTLCREKAEAMGALTLFANTEVTGFGVEGGRIRSVETTPWDGRGRVRRHRVRRLGAGHRRDGRVAHPADARGPPDDRRRPGAALREDLAARSSSRSSATWTS